MDFTQLNVSKGLTASLIISLSSLPSSTDPITGAAVKFSQSVYRVGHSVNAFASISTHSSNQYNGNVYINVRFNNDTQTNSTLASPQHYTVTNGNTSFSFPVPEAGTLTVFVELYNDVSSIVTHKTLTVAGEEREGREGGRRKGGRRMEGRQTGREGRRSVLKLRGISN